MMMQFDSYRARRIDERMPMASPHRADQRRFSVTALRISLADLYQLAQSIRPVLPPVAPAAGTVA